MSDASQGEGWWLASDGKWYPPTARPSFPPPPAPNPPPLAAAMAETQPPTPPKRSKTWPWLAGGGTIIVALLIVAAVMGNGSDTTIGGASSATTTTSTAAADGRASPAPTTPPTAIVSTMMAGTAHPAVTPGTIGQLDVVYIGAPISNSSLGTIVPVVVWNGTGQTAAHIDVSGIAKDAAGTVLGSGDSQDINPTNVAAQGVAFGMVYFRQSIPIGSSLNLTATGDEGPSSYLLDAQVAQANFSPSQFGHGTITGEVINPQAVTMRGPIEADAYCFSNAGLLTGVFPGFISGDGGLAPGATAGYSISIYLDVDCPTFLVGSSGFAS